MLAAPGLASLQLAKQRCGTPAMAAMALHPRCLAAIAAERERRNEKALTAYFPGAAQSAAKRGTPAEQSRERASRRQAATANGITAKPDYGVNGNGGNKKMKKKAGFAVGITRLTCRMRVSRECGRKDSRRGPLPLRSAAAPPAALPATTPASADCALDAHPIVDCDKVRKGKGRGRGSTVQQ